MRNLKIGQVLADNGDAIGIDESTNVWVDHCDLSGDLSAGKDDLDGLLDITHAAEWVTVSNTYLHDHVSLDSSRHWIFINGSFSGKPLWLDIQTATRTRTRVISISRMPTTTGITSTAVPRRSALARSTLSTTTGTACSERASTAAWMLKYWFRAPHSRTAPTRPFSSLTLTTLATPLLMMSTWVALLTRFPKARWLLRLCHTMPSKRLAPPKLLPPSQRLQARSCNFASCLLPYESLRSLINLIFCFSLREALVVFQCTC